MLLWNYCKKSPFETFIFYFWLQTLPSKTLLRILLKLSRRHREISEMYFSGEKYEEQETCTKISLIWETQLRHEGGLTCVFSCIKDLYWHPWFHEALLTFTEPFYSTKVVKKIILRTVRRRFFRETNMVLLWHHFENPISEPSFLRAYTREEAEREMDGWLDE